MTVPSTTKQLAQLIDHTVLRAADAYAFDTTLNLVSLVGQFADPNAPAGYAPFNIVSIEGRLFVSFAKQGDTKQDDVPGRGHGLIDTFDLQSRKFTRFATGSDAGGHLHQIDSPWGVPLAPGTFGKHASELLVG